MGDSLEKIITLLVAKGLLSEAPDYYPESTEAFTMDTILLAESLQKWADSGDELAVLNFFTAFRDSLTGKERK